MTKEIITGKDGRQIDLGLLDPNTRAFIKQLRSNLSKEFGIELYDFLTSGGRSDEENAKVGGSKNSNHLKKKNHNAFDFSPNPIIQQYLERSKEGLNLLEKHDLGYLDETVKTKGTGAHIHIGKDNSAKRAKTLRNELIIESAEGIAEPVYLTPKEIIASNPDFIDPDKVKEQITQDSITPEQKEVRKQNDSLKAKADKLKAAQADYEKAQTIGLKEGITKAKNDYDDAAYDLYKSNNDLRIDAQKARKDVLIREIGLYDENTDQYKSRVEELDTILESLNEADKKKKPSLVVGGKKIPEQRGLSKQDFINSRDGKGKYLKANDRAARVSDASLLANYNNFQSELPKLTGEIDFDKPEERERLIQQLEKNTAEQEQAKAKVNAIVQKKQQIAEQEIDSQNIDAQKKQQQKQELLIGQEGTIDTAGRAKELDQQAEDYFSRFSEPQELIRPQQFDYNSDNYKKEIPFEALGFGALALSGMNDARTELPLRDEKVSQAILQYTADLKRLSEQGLKPEEEAKMKDQLTGAYSAGLNQLVRASGGDRNVVLGNLHTLNNAKMRGITDIGLADIAIKQQNFEKYGQAIKEIQAFRTNTEIANHQIKLDEAKQKQQSGAALASSGFASMLEELQYQKENGPGSANHRSNKMFEIMLTGVDSEKPDDGSPNTPSWQKANLLESANLYKENSEKYQGASSNYDKWMALPANEKIKFNSFQDFIQKPKETPNPVVNGGGFSSMILNDYYQDQ